MLICESMSISYGKHRVLEEVTFTAKPGEITVLLGRNGCGKSTLLRAIAGCIACGGRIMHNDTDLSRLKPSERARCVSMMPQNPRTPEISVRELALCARQPYTGILASLSQTDRAAAERAIAEVGIERLADRRLSELSGGEVQKAYFAMLTAQDTPVILLDEPTASLDSISRTELSSRLRAFADSGKTVLAVLHDINLALTLADRIIVLSSDGSTPARVSFDGDSEGFRGSGIAERIFGLRPISGVYYG